MKHSPKRSPWQWSAGCSCGQSGCTGSWQGRSGQECGSHHLPPTRDLSAMMQLSMTYMCTLALRRAASSILIAGKACSNPKPGCTVSSFTLHCPALGLSTRQPAHLVGLAQSRCMAARHRSHPRQALPHWVQQHLQQTALSASSCCHHHLSADLICKLLAYSCGPHSISRHGTAACQQSVEGWQEPSLA